MAVTFCKHELDNGLVIIGEVDPEAHSAAAGLFVRTGARDEPAVVMGVSHFLEHMMFKGTDDISADELNRRFDGIGARNNAYTTGEITCFYAHVLPERLGEGVDLLGRMLRPALRQDDFDTEKQVILEEIAMYRDNPFWVLYEDVTEKHYASNGSAHGLSHRVLGTAETVGAMTRDQMLAYFQQRYSADNTVLSVAGRVDFDAVCGFAESLCGGWERTGAARDASAPGVGGGLFERKDESVSQGYVFGLAAGPGVADDRRYAAALASQVLGADGNSRLHWALIEPGLAEEAQTWYDPHEGVGDFAVYASGPPDKLDEIWAAALREIEGLADSLTEDDLARLRAKMATAATLGGERPADRMQRIGRVWSALGEHRTLEEELERINSVTLDDVRGVIGAFPMAPTTVGRLSPG